jgi:drug/metabolite transporter (DMT)-like permease
VLSLIALVLFDVMGLIIKHLSPRFSAIELSAYRNVVGLIPSLIVLWTSSSWQSAGQIWKIRQWRLALFRGLILTVAQICLYLSFGLMNFATASTITYANALFITALAVPLLGEQGGKVRWAAVIIGFIGVIMIVGPGRDAFEITAFLPLVAAMFYALAGVTARMMDDDVPTPLINLYATGMAAIATVILANFTTGYSQIIKPIDWVWIIGMGCFGGTAVLFLIASYRLTEQSNLAPFSYFGIPIAFVLGWVFFGEAPWSELFPGAVLIIVGGLLIIWRERTRLKD